MDSMPFGMGRKSTRGHVRRKNNRSIPIWMVIVAGIIGIVAIYSLVQFVWPEEEAVTQRNFNNRTWLNDTWTTTPPKVEQIEAMANRVQDHNVDMVYVVPGAWRVDNNYRLFDYACEFREIMSDVAPDVKVLAWIWVNNDFYTNNDSLISASNILDDLMENCGYDGVHVQGYAVFDGNESYVRLLRSLDAVVDDHGGILSITGPPDRRPADPDIPVAQGNQTTSWSPRFKRQLALIVDEIVIMPIGSGIKSAEDYREWFAYQVTLYAQEIDSINSEVDIVIGMPTNPEEDLHDPSIENISNAIEAANEGFENAGDSRDVIIGGAVYLYDTTNTQDWVFFQREWNDK